MISNVLMCQMDVQDISLQTILTSCEEMESLIINCLGPIGSFGMILNSTGHVLVISDGLEILQKANFNTPIQQLVINAIFKHSNLSGGQVKQFIIILTEFLRNFLKFKIKHSLVNMAHFRQLISVILTNVLPEIFHNIIKLTENVPNIINCSIIIARLIEGFMAGKFSKKINITLSHLLHSLIMQTSNQMVPLNLVIQALQSNFNLICCCISGQSVTSSYIDKGFVIQANLHSDKNEFSGNYILVNKCYSFNENENVKYQCCQKNELRLKQEWHERQLKELLQSYCIMDIHLLLSANKVPSYILGFCKQNNITVIDEIDEEELENISVFTGIHVMETLHKHVENLFIGKAKIVKRTKFGCHHYLQIDVEPNKSGFNFNVCHMKIFAPTDDLGRHYKKTILNCLKSLMLSFQSFLEPPLTNNFCFNGDVCDNQELLKIMQSKFFRTTYLEEILHLKNTFTIDPQFIVVGGATEFLIYHELQNYIKNHEMGRDLKFFIECLSDAILRIPKIVYKNSFQNGKPNFVTISHNLIIRCSTDLATIEGNTGSIVNAEHMFGCEPLSGKYILIENLLTLITQLMKLDLVIFNKENKKETTI